MRFKLGTAIAALVLAGATNATASVAPDQIVGRWAAERTCANAGFSYVMKGDRILRELRDNGKVYRTPVKVTVDGDVVRVWFDEKVFSFRLPTRNTLQPVGYTDLRNGLTAVIAPRVWHRCS